MSLGAVLRAPGGPLGGGSFVPESQGTGDRKAKAKDLGALLALTTVT